MTERRLKGWESRGLVTPSIRRELSPRNTVRLYSFRDVLAVLVVRELIDAGAHPRTVGRLVDHLSAEYPRPFTQLRWAVVGKRLYVQHLDQAWVGDQAPEQTVLWQLLDLEPLRAEIRNTLRPGRMPDDVGKTERRRRVMGSKEVFAGTRVPVEAVTSYLRRGIDEERILKAFPQLRSEDVAAARRSMPV